jgi:uncharacterized membrane protein YesL
MRWIFDINNPIMRYVIKIFDCMCLSVLWLVMCLPVFTIGASTTAMFAVIHRYIRLEEESLWKLYWKSFREEFKRTTLCTLVAIGILALLVVDALVFRTMVLKGQLLGNLYWLILLVIGIEATWLTYLFAYVERFTGGVRDTMRFSFLMMILHPVKSLTILALVLGSGALVILAPGLLAIVPAACCWLCDIVVASVFVLHLREEDRQRLEESRQKSADDV